MCCRCGHVPTAAGTWRVTGIDTSHGPIDLAPGGTVVIALGTIENARLALASFDGTGLPTLPLIGKNLIAHLRSNLVIRVPRAAISGLSAAANELQTAALFVKGRATRQNGDLIGRFHLQISASGGGSTARCRGRTLPQGSRCRLLRPAAHLDGYSRGDRDPRPWGNGACRSRERRRPSKSGRVEYPNGRIRSSPRIRLAHADRTRSGTLERDGCGHAEGGGHFRQRAAHAGHPKQSRRARNHAS